MQAKEYTTGHADATFGVDRPSNRGQLASVLYGMSGETAAFPARSPFPDVTGQDTFYAPAVWFHPTEMVSDYPEGTFRPARTVTRGEAAKFRCTLEARLNGAPPAYRVSAASCSTTTNATGGTGGVFTGTMAIRAATRRRTPHTTCTPTIWTEPALTGSSSTSTATGRSGTTSHRSTVPA